MKKKTLAFLLSACLLAQSAGFVSAADFSSVPEESVNAEEIFSPEDGDTSSTDTESVPSTSAPVTDPESDQVSELLPEETVPEDVELESEDPLTENDSEDLLFDDGESDAFNDGSDSSSAAFASSEIPDHDIWLADTVRTGLVVDGKNIQTKSLYNLITQASVKPVYQELGERILSNKPILVLSSIWKGVIKQEFYDDQKLIYEALLTDYLKFVDSTDSKGFDSSQIERANSYLIKMFNDLSTYYTQNGVYTWKPEDFMKLSADEANKLLQSVDSMKNAVSLVGDTCSTTKELVELCTKVNAFKNAADERILLIQKARNAGSSNTAFAEACDAILAQLGSQSIDVSYLRSQSASAAMKKCTETMISELSKQNPVLKALSYGSSAMDILFNTSSINSDNLKLSLLYTMDCYFNTALTSSSSTYTRYKNADNANTFVKCFQGYTTFQIYADNVAKSYISGVTSGGVLNRTFADIFYREGVENAESWKTLCDDQINIRRNILNILAKFYQVYNRFYLKDEYINALKDQTTATPTPTPKPLVPVDYEVTVPESPKPMVETHSFSDGTGWSYFEDGTLVLFGSEIFRAKIERIADVKKLIISEGPTSIGPYATYDSFRYWTNLKSVWLPESLTSISNFIFSDCSNLEEVHFSSNVINLERLVFKNCTSLKTITFPENVSLNEGCFKGCSSLDNIVLPDSLTTIPSSCFYGCTSLQNIVLPDTIKNIESYAFTDCTNLQQINIPDSVTNIAEHAFENCCSLKSIVLPIGLSGSKLNCSAHYAGSHYLSNDSFINCQGISDYTFYNCSGLKEVTFKKGNTTQLIGAYAFAGCSQLQKFNISDNIKFIDHHAFENCSSLAQINLQHVQGLCHDVFKNCSSLKNVSFPKDAIQLSSNVFQNCRSLENVELSGTLYDSSFSGCTNLKKAIIHTALFIDDNAFYNCKNLTEIILPKKFTVYYSTPLIGKKAFYNCIKLKNITFPDDLDSIDTQCFYNCQSLQSITFPKDTYTLEKECFANCNNLKSITFLRSKYSYRFTCDQNAFKGCSNLKIIYGHSDTDAVTTAKQLGLTFVSLDVPSVIPSGLTLTPGNRYFKAIWKKASSINGYQIQYSKNKNFSQSTSKLTGNGNTTTLTVKNLTVDQTYYVRIRAYKNANSKKYYGKWSTPKAVTVLPVKVPTASTPVLKSGKQYFRASWKKTSATSGYQIQYSLYKNFKNPVTKTLAGNTKTNITVSRLKRSKRYYVRVRAYRNANSKKYYGKWSGTRSIIVTSSPHL